MEDLVAGQRVVRAHFLGPVHVEGAREHRQPLPQRPFRRRAQLVAPVHRRPQRLVPGAGAAAAGRQQPDPGLQLGGQFGERERAQPHGGELDGERYAVKPRAKPDDVGPVLRRDGEPGDDRRRALGEQVRRVGLGRQGKQRVGVLALGVERLPAGREQSYPRGGAQHGVGERGTGVDQVLARVEDEQQPPAAQVAQDTREVRFRQPERLGDGFHEQRGIADAAKVGEQDAVRKLVSRLRRGAQASPRLADPGRADDRHHAGGAKESADPGQFGRAADKAGGFRRQEAMPSLAGDLASADDKDHGYLMG